MTSAENFGPQFKDHVLVHRGIRHVGPNVASGELGVHWSYDPVVAERFADYSDHYTSDPQYYKDNQGVVVSALVHKNDIIEPDSDEWHEAQHWGSAMNNEIYGPEHSEQEATVRPGSPVHIVALKHAQDNTPDYDTTVSERRMRYRTPRISKA